MKPAEGKDMDQTIPVRSGEELNLEQIRSYLSAQLEDFPDAPLTVRQFSAGRSNLTYLLTSGGWEGVLRRPPFGPLPTKAHDMSREFTVLTKLRSEFSLVPKPFVFCSDESVIGSPFYIMERVRGITLEDDPTVETGLTFEDKQEISEQMVDALAKLHAVNYERAGLSSIGYPDGFIERQLKNWIARYEKCKTEEVPSVERVVSWLEGHMPKKQAPTLIHNDFKINNVLLSENYRSIKAILDWEMATIGDPLFDLGATLSYWFEEGDPELLRSSIIMPTAQPGFFTRREFLELYAKKTGRDVSDFQFYIIFAYFKIGVAVQQMYYRYSSGQTDDPRFANTGISAKNLMQHAENLTYQKGW